MGCVLKARTSGRAGPPPLWGSTFRRLVPGPCGPFTLRDHVCSIRGSWLPAPGRDPAAQAATYPGSLQAAGPGGGRSTSLCPQGHVHTGPRVEDRASDELGAAHRTAHPPTPGRPCSEQRILIQTPSSLGVLAESVRTEETFCVHVDTGKPVGDASAGEPVLGTWGWPVGRPWMRVRKGLLPHRGQGSQASLSKGALSPREILHELTHETGGRGDRSGVRGEGPAPLLPSLFLPASLKPPPGHQLAAHSTEGESRLRDRGGGGLPEGAQPRDANEAS